MPLFIPKALLYEKEEKQNETGEKSFSFDHAFVSCMFSFSDNICSGPSIVVITAFAGACLWQKSIYFGQNILDHALKNDLLWVTYIRKTLEFLKHSSLESNDSTEQKDEDLSDDIESRALTKRSLTTSLQVGAMEFWEKIKDFYMSPIVRFVYHTISYVLFLVLFIDFKVKMTGVEYIVLAWVITLLIEEVKQIAWPEHPLSPRKSDEWKPNFIPGIL
ncbi:hypothetical protein ACTXT7_007269 [Hymenolepis weldensis]